MLVQPKYGGGCWGSAGVPLAAATTLHRLYNNNSSATPIQLSDMAAHASADTGPAGDMLDLSFVTEWSDDEGIGSDVSLETSDQSGAGDTLQRGVRLPRPGKSPPKRNISVKKFVRILRRGVSASASHQPSEAAAAGGGSDTAEAGSCTTVAGFQSQKVFGLSLTEHLEQSSRLVPRLVEFCCACISRHGLTDGVYRLSGQSSHIVTLKREFEGGAVPPSLTSNADVHAVASLLKVK